MSNDTSSSADSGLHKHPCGCLRRPSCRQRWQRTYPFATHRANAAKTDFTAPPSVLRVESILHLDRPGHTRAQLYHHTIPSPTYPRLVRIVLGMIRRRRVRMATYTAGRLCSGAVIDFCACVCACAFVFESFLAGNDYGDERGWWRRREGGDEMEWNGVL